MSILVDKNTRLMVQGITGKEGSFHTLACRDYGTSVVAGVTPGKGGVRHEGIPVFDTVREAVDKEGANTAMIFVPAAFAADAMLEALRAKGGRPMLVATENPNISYDPLTRRHVKRGEPIIGDGKWVFIPDDEEE